VTNALPSPATAEGLAGGAAAGGAERICGVTEVVASEASEEPWEFVATTLKVYDPPDVSPVIAQVVGASSVDVATVEQLRPPGDAVTT
jgi:hypothetical protein